MLAQVQRFGQWGIDLCARIGLSGLFAVRTLVSPPKLTNVLNLLVRQLYQLGVRSFIIIAVSALFIGMVIALQGYNTLQTFSAQQQLGQLVALTIVRELGPVVTALLFAGRAGSALAAELGLMRATQQLASMEMMAVNPMRRIVAPRFWAAVLAVPLLTLIFNMIAIYGSYWVGVGWMGIDAGSFWTNMHSSVDFRNDVLNGVIKSIVFGFAIAWIAVFQGYYSDATASGISQGTTRTVVYSSLAILGLDFILTAMMLRGW